jgi:hypothetical protein
VVAAAAFSVALNGTQVDALVRLLAAVALDVRRAVFALRPAMLALRYWPALLVNVL